ncbi:MAG: hypothetical protein DRJ96_03815 [Thermoprotei archaeon]|nr:MAG: hypothetical protein DRJ67_12250 [Thermoprotei archaeon]RLE97449.1 MAG: hypothetical protein DRJ96_03815 [Thermoprotei archaeon]
MRGTKRELRVFHLSALDLDVSGDLFVVAKDREQAIRLVVQYYEERIREALADITDELEDEEYESFLEEGLYEVIEEH